MGQRHFTKDLGHGADSQRRILPDRDGVPVKVTWFYAPAGTFFPSVVARAVETVYMVKGRCVITSVDGTTVELNREDVCVISAEHRHSFKAEEDCVLLCVYGVDPSVGELPDSE